MKYNKKIKLKNITEEAHDIIPYMESSRRSLYVPPKNARNGKSYGAYDKFLVKYHNLESSIDKFNSKELVYYFKECSKENGYNYFIANIAKDAHIFKRLKEEFSNREICGMIEFMYTSEQDYLEKNKLSPNILASGWVNTIYADYKLWIEDKYYPKSKNKGKRNNKHEWNDSKAETSIGGWGN